MKAIGIVGYSGAGKTTLIEGLIPRLLSRGVRASAIKHAHHGFVPDVPGKDSDRLRRAGAAQTLVVGGGRMALMTELPQGREEPGLPELLAALDPDLADVVLVEGMKAAAYPKIEVHRAALGHPLRCGRDPWILAVAADGPLPVSCPLLPLGDPEAVADYIVGLLRQDQTGAICMGGRR
jgi:molybdopterin-guanine dinucleotide biosynthesis protein B